MADDGLSYFQNTSPLGDQLTGADLTYDSSLTSLTGVATAPASPASDTIDYFTNPTAGVSPSAIANLGTGLDLSAGAKPTSSTGTSAVIPKTGNSVLDGLGSITNILVSDAAAATKAYGSYLESSAVANAANRLGTTPQAVVSSLPTVPGVTANGQAVTNAANGQLLLYIALGVGAFLLIKAMK